MEDYTYGNRNQPMIQRISVFAETITTLIMIDVDNQRRRHHYVSTLTIYKDKLHLLFSQDYIVVLKLTKQKTPCIWIDPRKKETTLCTDEPNKY